MSEDYARPGSLAWQEVPLFGHQGAQVGFLELLEVSVQVGGYPSAYGR
jgi:hypothetical protein